MDAWKACRDADVLLESPSAMAGVHIAEALSEEPFSLFVTNTESQLLDIPYVRTFTMPWTKLVFALIS